MEALYLVCSIFSTILTSFTLSLLLPFRLLLRRLFPPSTPADAIALYEGTVWHERRRPVHHSFKYSVRYALIDLDHALHSPPDHLSPRQARDIARTNGPVFLLTIPPSVGYEQNPLSLYYCYDFEGSNRCDQYTMGRKSADMLGSWSMRTNTPGDTLVVNISVKHPKLGDYFTASLTANRVSSSSVQHALFFWLMPHKHPRYGYPSYKEDAMERDRNLGCCQAFATQTDKHQRAEQSRDPNFTSAMNQKDRWFRWRDAKWPWC
ncbi:Protein of unknown function DUF1365 [Cynara cardunculus var. scolymus]|uniref:Uncharacterized protein n=1 Tax=Cynara cardunculus var. scolymus TaxID=59895 RepID=A0A103XUX3_CYNCS|nr:Protein of unknown function DUF1365 [Cynara cardunculus var. scolymus]